MCQCESYARMTERAALGGARWLGRADEAGAERDAAKAMREVLDGFPIRGRIVIGSSDEESPLRAGDELGSGGEPVDLALDPLEGRGVVARGGNGAMSMVAVGDPGSLLRLPDMYMRKIAVGPRARGSIDLLKPMAENIAAMTRPSIPTGSRCAQSIGYTCFSSARPTRNCRAAMAGKNMIGGPTM